MRTWINLTWTRKSAESWQIKEKSRRVEENNKGIFERNLAVRGKIVEKSFSKWKKEKKEMMEVMKFKKRRNKKFWNLKDEKEGRENIFEESKGKW